MWKIGKNVQNTDDIAGGFVDIMHHCMLGFFAAGYIAAIKNQKKHAVYEYF